MHTYEGLDAGRVYRARKAIAGCSHVIHLAAIVSVGWIHETATKLIAARL